MAESLKAFENLRENVKNSLSSQEKADLRKISPDDIKSQREKVWEKSFAVDGKSMKLKDIVKNLTFDEEGEKAELKINGKKVAIGWQSELWVRLSPSALKSVVSGCATSCAGLPAVLRTSSPILLPCSS